MTTPANLDELRRVKDPAARALAAAAYIAAREEAIREARRIRDAAIVEYAKEHSISQTAKACGVSESTVKVVTR
jgi:AraC-like DNA-binding protein